MPPDRASRGRARKEPNARLAAAKREERRRIAQLLHDDVQQLLYGADTTLRVAQHDLATADGPTLAAHLEKARDFVRRALAATRGLTAELATPEPGEVGLEQALLRLSSDIRELHGIDVRLEMAASPNADADTGSLARDAVRELVFNAVKHAGVAQVIVRVDRAADDLVVHVIDEGNGFDVVRAAENRAGIGLANLEAKLAKASGRLVIRSAPGRGTHVEVRVPLRA